MALEYEYGNCNGVSYAEGARIVFGRTGCFFVHSCPTTATRLFTPMQVSVHKSLLRRPGKQLVTKTIPALGYDWKACVTANENGSMEAVWRLRSPVVAGASLRCCWMITKPVRIPGPSTLLQQNGRYGGTIADVQPNSSGFIVISFLIQVYAPNEEELTIHEGQTETCCVWRLKPHSSEAFFWANRFFSRGKIWGLFLYNAGHGRTKLEVTDLYHTESILHDSQAVMIDPSSLENSRIQKHQGSQDRTISFVFDQPPTYGEIDDSFSFAFDGWLKFGLRLSFLGRKAGLADEFHQLETQRVVIGSITNRTIQAYVRRFGSIHLRDVSGSQIYLFPPHWSLKTIKQMIQKQPRPNASKATFWLRCGKRDGIYSRAVSLNALAELDFRLCELSEQRDTDNRQVVTLYMRTSEDDHLLARHPPPSAVLLFCMFLNPRENKLEYFGSIVADGDTKLHSICFDDLYGLHKKLQDMDCAFFIVDAENRATQIRAFQKTAREFGLLSGSTVVIRPLAENEAVTPTGILRELQAFRQERQRNNAPYNSPLHHDHFTGRNTRCIVCLQNPQTSGFYHGETVHVCACEECARSMYREGNRRCPICMEPYTGLVSKIF